MLQVVQQDDGRYAVRDIGGRDLQDVLGIFPTQQAADEWMLTTGMNREAGAGDGTPIRPGDGEGSR